ncbi:MAG: helix-turn-helix domain-containing protein [Chloroflexi bacterium]|nr:helix-turn-helix domain-containing protein [Chloroflexota bacterium]
MDDKTFQELLESVRQGGAILRGERPPARAFAIPPADVKSIRQRLGMTQETFARFLGVSVSTVRNWEQNRRQPRGAARLLLLIAQRHPEVLLDLYQEIPVDSLSR